MVGSDTLNLICIRELPGDIYFADENDDNEYDDQPFHYEIYYEQRIDNETINDSIRRILVTPEEMSQIRSLVQYSMPALLGWHVIYNPSSVGA